MRGDSTASDPSDDDPSVATFFVATFLSGVCTEDFRTGGGACKKFSSGRHRPGAQISKAAFKDSFVEAQFSPFECEHGSTRSWASNIRVEEKKIILSRAVEGACAVGEDGNCAAQAVTIGKGFGTRTCEGTRAGTCIGGRCGDECRAGMPDASDAR